LTIFRSLILTPLIQGLIWYWIREPTISPNTRTTVHTYGISYFMPGINCSDI
jgi:hypothetical protein